MFDEKTLPAFAHIEDPAQFIRDLESGNDETTSAITKSENPGAESHSVFTLYSNDTNENYLNIENQIAGTNNKGKLKFDSQPIVSNISISEALSNALEGK